jgi:hypothetical protein
MWIPATWLDYTAFALVLIGIVGMVSHFWLQEYGGMAWSAITVGAGIIAVGVHVALRLRHASLPRAVSAHIVLAFFNVLGAGAWCLLAAALLDAVNVARILRHAFVMRPAAGPAIVTVP